MGLQKWQTSNQDKHLLSVIDNVLNNMGIKKTVAEYYTIKVTGDGLEKILETVVGQFPILDMKMYKVKKTSAVQTKYKRSEQNVDVHIIYHTPIGVDRYKRMR